MVRKIVTVWPTHTLAQVAAVLLREGISGVPVVTEDRICVGVFSVTDIMRAEERVAGAQQEFAQSNYFSSDLALPASVYAEKLREVQDKIAPAAEHPVRDFMTKDIVSINEDTPLEKVVTSMVDAHVHRLLVVDQAQRLTGIVSTIDVLAALMRASRNGR